MATRRTRVFEDEFRALHAQVERLYGSEACLAAGHRAYARAADLLNDPEVWLFAFEDLWMDELQRLLAN